MADSCSFPIYNPNPTVNFGNPVAPQSSVTYTSYIDSNDRERDGPDPENPTNDIVIPVNLQQPRARVEQLYLGSLEIRDFSQYSVERSRANLLFDMGFWVSSSGSREFEVRVDHSTFSFPIPLLMNNIIAVSGAATTTPTLTCQFEHALYLASFWEDGKGNIELLGTEVQPFPILDFTIVDDFSFTVELSAPIAWVSAGHSFGTLYFSPIANPVTLASMLTFAFREEPVLKGRLSLIYDPLGGLFELKDSDAPECKNPENRLGLETCCPGTLPAFPSGCFKPKWRILEIVIKSSQDLASLLGFGFSNVLVDCNTIKANFGFRNVTELVVPTGNYTTSTFGSALRTSFNPFFFDSLCGLAAPIVLVFTNLLGCVTAPIPFGQYTPITLALEVQTAMNLADPTGSYSVEWVSEENNKNNTIVGHFEFEETNFKPFGLEFNVNAATTFSLVTALGFDHVNYRGLSSYQGNRVTLPSLGPCTSDSKFVSTDLQITFDGGSLRYQFALDPPRIANVISFTATGGGFADIVTTQASGLQVDDAVIVDAVILGVHVLFSFRVTHVSSAFLFTVDLGSAASVLTATSWTVSLSGPLWINMYFAERAGRRQLLPRYLGFKTGGPAMVDRFFSSFFSSQFEVSLSPFTCLYLMVVSPVGATHNSKEDEKGGVLFPLAKINTSHNTIHLERMLPFNQFFNAFPQMIPSMHFLLINPDGSVFDLHGLNWTASIVFSITEITTNIPCY